MNATVVHLDSAEERGHLSEGPFVKYGGQYEWLDNNTPQCKALRWIRPGSRVLEVGTGEGGVTRLLHDKLSCRIVGIDLNESVEAAQYCERFIVGDVTDPRNWIAFHEQYDYVLFLDVLEHLPYPDKFLRKFREIIPSSAQIVVTLPNFLVWHVRLPICCGKFAYSETGTLDRTHLRFFTPESARELLQGSGYKVLKQEVSWNVPIIGWLRTTALVADLDNLPKRVRRRVPYGADLVLYALSLQKRLNALGLVRTLDSIGDHAARVSPRLFANHVVLLAMPA